MDGIGNSITLMVMKAEIKFKVYFLINQSTQKVVVIKNKTEKI